MSENPDIEKDQSPEKQLPPRDLKDMKFDDFDAYDVSEALANSITDDVIRSYSSHLMRKFKLDANEHGAENTLNVLDVKTITDSIRKELETKLPEKISEELTSKVVTEISEQYHAKEGTKQAYYDKKVTQMRWLLLPVFILFSAVLVLISVVFFSEVVYLFKSTIELVQITYYSVVGIVNPENITFKESINSIIAQILSILDLTLIGTLVIMVLVGAYENSISRIGMSHDVPTWFGKLDIAHLKIKVAASIVIISSIHLLMFFMKIGDSENIEPEKIMWITIIHIVFVLSAIALAYMEKIMHSTNKKAH